MMDMGNWWSLHLRSARGEHLTEAERKVYEEGLQCLHRGESFEGEIESLLEVRAQVAGLEKEHHALSARRNELQAEIDALEAALSERTRELLGVS